MKPAPFEYVRARTLDEALDTLTARGNDAKVLAGGQSLIPMMNLRLAQPAVVVDINEVGSLQYLRPSSGTGELIIGPLARHVDLERRGGLLRAVARHIGHLPIRTRGTFAGSLAHADPVAEWCILALATGATIEVASASGRRLVPADDFFVGFLTTSLADDEMVTEVRLPLARGKTSFAEMARRHGDFAIVAVAVTLTTAEDGTCRDARVAVGGVSSVPVRLYDVERLLVGHVVEGPVITEAAAMGSTVVEPHGDLHATARQRRALTAALVDRALRDCLDVPRT